MSFKKNRLSIIGVVMALIFGLVSVVPALAATVTGTIALDKDFVFPTGTVTITVTDADLNTVTAVKQDVTITGSGAGVSQGFTLTTGSGVEVSGTPVVLDNDGTTTNTAGTATAATDTEEDNNYVVTVFNAAAGTIFVQSFLDPAALDANEKVITISYNTATAQTTTATVTSPSDATGISVTLTETGVNTGIFTGTFTNTTGTSSGSAIQAATGQIITVKYTDAAPAGTRSDTVTVEATKPSAAVVSPANNSFSTSLTPKLEVDFTDSDSGVSATAGDIVFTIVSATDNDGNSVSVTGNGTVTTTAITNGYRASVTLGGISAAKTVKITWNATAKDKAGNTGNTDSSATTAGNQNHVLLIDNVAPVYGSSTAYAGRHWSTALTTTDKTESTTTKSSSTTIAVVLPDILTGTKESLDATTVAASDFEIDSLKKADGTTVNDVTPTAAVVHAGAPNTVFLTVPAMAPDATPKVLLKGVIADTAGNTVNTGTVTAADKQSPTLTAVTSASIDKAKITVTITSDENLGTTPTLTANNASQTVTLSGTKTYTSTVTVGKGVYAVEIAGQDVAGNAATAGNDITTAKFPTAASVVFYIDDNLPAPTVTPAEASSTEITEPFFITIDFVDEGKEYGLDSGSAMTSTAANVVTDLDVNATVTVNSVTLDGVDVTASLDTLNNIKYDLAIAGIATGAHKLVILATDEAGNTLGTTGLTVNFTVTARSQYSVPLTVGWNLVSLPADPEDSAIDSVVPSTHPATQILTYDPSASDGPWLVATRATDGTWTGTLTTVDSSHAYWVNTTSSSPIKTLLKTPTLGAAILPSIAVVAGWNLVPVVDLGQQAAGDLMTAGTYLGSIGWKVAYGFGTTGNTNAWERVATGDNIETGKGYWVWASADGTLVP